MVVDKRAPCRGNSNDEQSRDSEERATPQLSCARRKTAKADTAAEPEAPNRHGVDKLPPTGR